MNSSRLNKRKGSQRPVRIPRSISEQNSILARQGTILTGNPDALPNEMRDLMDLRARGIFDDRDVTDLLEAIKRTEKACASSSSKQPLNTTKPRQPVARKRSPLKEEVSFSEETLEIGAKISPSKLKSSSEIENPLKGSSLLNRIKPNIQELQKVKVLEAFSSSERIKARPTNGTLKANFKNTTTWQATSAKTVTIDPSVQPSSNSQVEATLASSIDEVKSILSEMTPENIPQTQKRLQISIDKALDSLASDPPFFGRASKLNLNHSLSQIKEASFSLDPYNVDIMKDVLLRHLGSAESIVVTKLPSKLPERKPLAAKMCEYAAKDPTGAILVPAQQHALRKDERFTPKPTKIKKGTRIEQKDLDERLEKEVVVQLIDRAKTNVSMTNAQNIEIVKEGVCRMINEATIALQGLKEPLTENNKKAVNELLQEANQMTLNWTIMNLDAMKKCIYQRLKQAVNILIPSYIHITESPSRQDSLTKQQSKQIEKIIVVDGVVSKLEEAVDAIRGNCMNNDLVLLISPLQDASKKEIVNLQITAVNRKTAVINGHFLLTESNYISMAKAGAFSRYFTVRISRDLKFFEKQIDQILRCANEIPIVDRQQQQIAPHRTKLGLLLKPPLNENMPTLTSAAIRRSITINPRDELNEQSAPIAKKEPTISELLHTLSTEFCTEEDLDLFFMLVDKYQFLIFAHPDFQDDRSIYICEVFTSSSQYVGTTKIHGEDILVHLQKRSGVIKNFEMIVDITDLMLPAKLKRLLSGLFHKIGLLSVYDRVAMLIFNIYKKWGLSKSV